MVNGKASLTMLIQLTHGRSNGIKNANNQPIFYTKYANPSHIYSSLYTMMCGVYKLNRGTACCSRFKSMILVRIYQ